MHGSKPGLAAPHWFFRTAPISREVRSQTRAISNNTPPDFSSNLFDIPYGFDYMTGFHPPVLFPWYVLDRRNDRGRQMKRADRTERLRPWFEPRSLGSKTCAHVWFRWTKPPQSSKIYYIESNRTYKVYWHHTVIQRYIKKTKEKEDLAVHKDTVFWYRQNTTWQWR